MLGMVSKTTSLRLKYGNMAQRMFESTYQISLHNYDCIHQDAEYSYNQQYRQTKTLLCYHSPHYADRLVQVWIL